LKVKPEECKEHDIGRSQDVSIENEANVGDNTGQQSLTFFLSHEEKYLMLIELLTLNSNM
jgi:hypothetical protein